MQFNPEESGKERRRKQQEYRSFLDRQIELKKKADVIGNNVEADRSLPFLALAGGSKHLPYKNPYDFGLTYNTVNSDTIPSHLARKGEADNTENGNWSMNLIADTAGKDKDKYLRDLEKRLETEVNLRYIVEKKTAVLDQKLDSLIKDSASTLDSLGTRDAAVREVCEEIRVVGSKLAALQEWRNHVDRSLALTPQMQEKIKQKVKTLEEEAFVRMQADEARHGRFREALEQLSGKIRDLTGRISAEDYVSLRRVTKLEAAFLAEARRARDATRQLKAQVQNIEALALETDSRMSSLDQKLRLLEKRQQEQHSAEEAQREEGTASRQQLQAPCVVTDTCRLTVESIDVPLAITALGGRVELVEGRINAIMNTTCKRLEDEIDSLRAEMVRLENKIDSGSVVTSLNALASNATAAQAETQSQFKGLQDVLSVDITARGQNSLRLIDVQKTAKKGDRESVVKLVSGLRALCLGLEEIMVRLTRDVETTQEDLLYQKCNPQATRKLEDSMADIQCLMRQQESEKDRAWPEEAAGIDNNDTLVRGNKEERRETEQMAWNTCTEIEARKQAEGKRVIDMLEIASERDAVCIEAVPLGRREVNTVFMEAIKEGDSANKARLNALRADMLGLGDKLERAIFEVHLEESDRMHKLLNELQEQALRERVHHEELARVKETQCFQRDLSTMLDTLESRMHLWVEKRLEDDRAVADEAAKRTQAVSEHIQGLLDETLTAVSKDIYSFRRESRSKNIPLDSVLKDRLAEVGPKVTKIDDGSAMTRQLDLLSRETGTRIDEMERRVRKSEEGLREEIEVKLALSSLLCSVADNASCARQDECIREETPRMGIKKKNEETEEELRVKLEQTNTLIERNWIEISETKAGVQELESRLMARIEELRVLMKATECVTVLGTAEAGTTREAHTKAMLTNRDNTTRNSLSFVSEPEQGLEKLGAADTGFYTQLNLVEEELSKKMADLTAVNDELKADDSKKFLEPLRSSPSPIEESGLGTEDKVGPVVSVPESVSDRWGKESVIDERSQSDLGYTPQILTKSTPDGTPSTTLPSGAASAQSLSLKPRAVVGLSPSSVPDSFQDTSANDAEEIDVRTRVHEEKSRRSSSKREAERSERSGREDLTSHDLKYPSENELTESGSKADGHKGNGSSESEAELPERSGHEDSTNRDSKDL